MTQLYSKTEIILKRKRTNEQHFPIKKIHTFIHPTCYYFYLKYAVGLEITLIVYYCHRKIIQITYISIY
jgi:hypothetical protein